MIVNNSKLCQSNSHEYVEKSTQTEISKLYKYMYIYIYIIITNMDKVMADYHKIIKIVHNLTDLEKQMHQPYNT